MELLRNFNKSENSEVNESSPAELSLSFEELGNATTMNESYVYSNATMRRNWTAGWIDDGEPYIFDRTDVRVIFFTIYTIVFCSCFFGNLMVILVVTLHWRMRSITNFCLGNLAFADLCVGVFCVYQNMISYFMDNWIFGDFMCKMYHFINTLSHTASILILVVICIERYLAIIHPMRCKQMLTLNRLRVTIVMVWIISAAYSSPRFYYINTLTMPLTATNGEVEVMCVPNRGVYNSKVMDMVSMLLLFLVPLFVISVLYTKIGIVLWRSSQNKMPSASPSESSTSSCGRESETTTNFTGRQLNRTTSMYRRSSSGVSLGNGWFCLNCPNKASRNAGRRKNHHMNRRGSCYLKNGENRYNDYESAAMELNTNLGNSTILGGENTGIGCSNYIQASKMENGDAKLPRTSSGGSSSSTIADTGTLTTSLCCGRLGKTCYLHGGSNTQAAKGNVSFSHPPVSPYLKRNVAIPISTAEPIVVVKFEKKSSLRKSKGKRNRCTILMNTQNGGNNREANEASPIREIPTEKKMCTLENERVSSCCAHVCFAKENEGRLENPLRNQIEDRLSLCLDLPEKNPVDSGVSTLNTPTLSLHGDQRPQTIPHPLQLQHLHHCHCSCSCCPYHSHNGTISNGPSTPNKLQSNFESGGGGAHAPKGVRRMRVVRGSKYGTRALQSRRRIIRMLIVIVFAFAVCNLPFHARKMWQYYGKTYSGGSVFSSLFTPLTFLVMYANSGINPILYAFMSKKFRMSFRDLLCCKLRRSLRISRNASIRSTNINPMSTAA